MKNQPLVSIAIIFKSENPYLYECVNDCMKLTYSNFEIVLLPDEGVSKEFSKYLKSLIKKIRVVTTGPLSIPKKRNLAVENSEGEYVAFIDDDAFPNKNWLSKSIPRFKEKQIGAVGGPNLTPPSDPILRRIAGNVMKSKLGFGKGYIRHKICAEQFVDELPTCNLIVRKSLFKTISFDETLVIGEDIKLCFDILRLGFKVLYVPNVIVYHHRRNLFTPFIKQFFYYGLYRGKQLKNNQVRHIYYLIPVTFSLFVIFGLIFSLIVPSFILLYLGVLVLYFLIMLFDAMKNSKLVELPLTWISLFIAHMTYGLGLVIGYFAK